MTVCISSYETPSIHGASYTHFNQGQIMQCVVTFATGLQS